MARALGSRMCGQKPLQHWKYKASIMWLNLAVGGEQIIGRGWKQRDKWGDFCRALERSEGSHFELCPSICFRHADLLSVHKCRTCKPFPTQTCVHHQNALLVFQMADSFPSFRSQLTWQLLKEALPNYSVWSQPPEKASIPPTGECPSQHPTPAASLIYRFIASFIVFLFHSVKGCEDRSLVCFVHQNIHTA